MIIRQAVVVYFVYPKHVSLTKLEELMMISFKRDKTAIKDLIQKTIRNFIWMK